MPYVLTWGWCVLPDGRYFLIQMIVTPTFYYYRWLIFPDSRLLEAIL